MYRFLNVQFRLMKLNLDTDILTSVSSVSVPTPMATLCLRRREVILRLSLTSYVQSEGKHIDCFYLQTFPPRTAAYGQYI